ncbi:MAG: hypothetical protein H8E66_31185 [Planctomycetes bacterium]|nr:hypothetical protein [Planctomycetota bacterium]
MRSTRYATTALLAFCNCAIGTSLILAEEVLPVAMPQPAMGPRVGIPELPEILKPMHWLHSDPNDSARSTGIGNPLKGTSWRNRPFHVGWMFGGLIGDTLIQGAIDQEDDLFGGYRLGWDFDHYWGTELRFAFAKPELIDVQGLTSLPTGTDKFWDLNLLYYPWGDAEWRPFASVGIGFASFRFEDANQVLVDDKLLTIPLGVGVKHYYRPWLALRTSVTDNLSIGSGALETMHNLSLSVGVEVHFGGPRKTYFPYHGGGKIW